MNFKDDLITKSKIDNVDNLLEIIVEYLCGEKYYKKELSETEKDLLSKLLWKIRSKRLNYAQFNELLLLMDQDRVSEAFFKFFFGETSINLKALKQGIIKFRGFAMLCFGNFRFAYKKLIQKNEEELNKALEPYCSPTTEVLKYFNRLPKALEIEKIKKTRTWFNGYISKRKYEKEAKYLDKLIKKEPLSQKLLDLYQKIGREIKKVEQTALRNTDIFLTWDYMDVYIATSMRNKWEYEETFDFITNVFEDKRLQKLNLRYFDPTQSQCGNRIDKGLIEGLMLKRSLCTIYMAQETDTMGKDSELASTLAQRKPVIAYVPYININKHAEKIKKYPLDYFKLRFMILRADGIFEEEKCRKDLKKYDSTFENIISNFETEMNKYRCSQPFSLWIAKENDFKRSSKFFSKICKILSIAEHHSFEKRAKTLKEVHPLSIQVHLESGVANGVLVVRNPKECTALLYNILTNSIEFMIRSHRHGVTILEEEISKCPFRVVTDYDKLTNSFWNFYLPIRNIEFHYKEV